MMNTHSETKKQIDDFGKKITSINVDDLLKQKTPLLNVMSQELLLMGKELLDVMDNQNISSEKKHKLNLRFRILSEGVNAAIDLRDALVTVLDKYNNEQLSHIHTKSDLIDVRLELHREKEKQKF